MTHHITMRSGKVQQPGGAASRRRAHAYWEGPGICYAEWGIENDCLRLFASDHAEGVVGDMKVYFTPIGSGECLPEPER